MTASWGWITLFVLGAYHGINPGMGWLFAVAMGLQEKSGRAVWRALVPITVGHAAAIAAAVLVAMLLHRALSMEQLKWIVAVLLFGFGAYHLVRCRHPRGAGMQVGAVRLATWSFLMASAHGAGLMLLPVLFGMSLEGARAHHHHGHAAFGDPGSALLAVAVHTAGYLLVTGAVAWIVYEKLGLALLRRAWINLDLIWGVALLATGAAVLFVL